MGVVWARSAGDTRPVAVTELFDTDPIRVGDALIVGRLGEGGMGVVYLGRGPSGTAVAVKVMRADLASNQDYRRRFAAEINAMRAVGASHTAGVIAADIAAPVPWVAMEYVQGHTLGERIARAGPLPPEELHPFALGLLRAVAGVHAAGVVHRDLKPSNVVLSPQGVRLLDFGVAKSSRGRAPERERVGSLTWMAPEQLAGTPIAASCDVHAVGMLLYYASTGRHVYGYGEAKAVAWRISHVEPQLVDLPDEATAYGDLILAALAKDPAARPSLRAMHERLRVRDAIVAGPPVNTSAAETRDHVEAPEWPRTPAPAVAEPEQSADLMSLVEVVAQEEQPDGPAQRVDLQRSHGTSESGHPVAWIVLVVLAVLVALAWVAGVWPFIR